MSASAGCGHAVALGYVREVPLADSCSAAKRAYSITSLARASTVGSTVKPSRSPVDYAALNRANFLRRPAISLGAGTAHQHCPLSVAQAASLKEGLDGLLVVDDCERARPVRAPQAAIETPRIKHAGKRIPNVRERIRLPGQRGGAADLDYRVRALGEFQYLREIGPGLRRRGRHARLHDAQMVDDESRVGMAIDERSARVQVAPAQDVDRKVVANRRA